MMLSWIRKWVGSQEPRGADEHIFNPEAIPDPVVMDSREVLVSLSAAPREVFTVKVQVPTEDCLVDWFAAVMHGLVWNSRGKVDYLEFAGDESMDSMNWWTGYFLAETRRVQFDFEMRSGAVPVLIDVAALRALAEVVDVSVDGVPLSQMESWRQTISIVRPMMTIC